MMIGFVFSALPNNLLGISKFLCNISSLETLSIPKCRLTNSNKHCLAIEILRSSVRRDILNRDANLSFDSPVLNLHKYMPRIYDAVLYSGKDCRYS